ncbi:MAG: 50S ribosomal protein L13, partial [Acidobacteriota bacterium]
ADKVLLSGRKEDQKIYRRHSGRPGGLKETTAREMRAKKPERMIELAVKGMLPKNSLGRALYRKLKVYSGPQHPHQAQQPEPLDMTAAQLG